MVTSAFINIWGRRAGAVVWDSRSGSGSFEFDPAFAKTGPDISPIMMPLAGSAGRVFSFPELRSRPTFRGLPGLLADVLPDRYGNALINAWLVRHGRPAESMNPVEILCFIGERGMGALEFEPAFPGAPDEASRLEVAALIRVTAAILAGRKKFRTGLSKREEKALIDILKIGSSAGGARAKAVVAYNPATGEVLSGQTAAPEGFSHWIMKFDGIHDRQFGASSGYGRVELAYHYMAVEAGIEMTECALLEENGRAHFMTRRFDRPGGDAKVHVQSLCGLRHFDFNDIGAYSYEQLFETMRMLALPYNEAEQMFRRMAFNVMGRNCDDHTKNFAFIMNRDGTWRISPAFDVCHAYRPGSDWVSQHSMSINGKRQNITRADLMKVAEEMNIRKPAALLEEVSDAVRRWPRYAKKAGVDKTLAAAISSTLLTL